MIRHSANTKANGDVGDWSEEFRERSNLDFFAAAFERLDGAGTIAIGLLGQRDLPGATLRRAQAVLRWDLRPSLWSHAFLVAGDPAPGGDIASTALREVTMRPRRGAFPDPADNAVTDAVLGDYADAAIDANAALIVVSMSAEQAQRVADRSRSPNMDRLRYDLWNTLGRWQTYLWSSGTVANPLTEGVPVFSSAYVEYCFEAMGLDVAPGTTERNSAPEHLWNAAMWWYEELELLGHPIRGACVLRDKYATLLDPDELSSPS